MPLVPCNPHTLAEMNAVCYESNVVIDSCPTACDWSWSYSGSGLNASQPIPNAFSRWLVLNTPLVPRNPQKTNCKSSLDMYPRKEESWTQLLEYLDHPQAIGQLNSATVGSPLSALTSRPRWTEAAVERMSDCDSSCRFCCFVAWLSQKRVYICASSSPSVFRLRSSNIPISKLYYLHHPALIPLIPVKMHSSAFSLIFLLGILPNPIVASAHVIAESVPLYSTLDTPFTLRSLIPKGGRVIVSGDGSLVATLDRTASTQFKLTNGSLTSLPDGRSAIFGKTFLPLPPPLIAIIMRGGAQPRDQVPFLAQTNYDQQGQQTLRLTIAGDRKFKKKNVPAKNWSWFTSKALVCKLPISRNNGIYAKPEGNISDVHLVHEKMMTFIDLIVRPNGRPFFGNSVPWCEYQLRGSSWRPGPLVRLGCISSAALSSLLSFSFILI